MVDLPLWKIWVRQWEGLSHILPIGSMYAIYGNIYHQYTPNVSIYTIHGSHILWKIKKFQTTNQLWIGPFWSLLLLKCLRQSETGAHTPVERDRLGTHDLRLNPRVPYVTYIHITTLCNSMYIYIYIYIYPYTHIYTDLLLDRYKCVESAYCHYHLAVSHKLVRQWHTMSDAGHIVGNSIQLTWEQT